MVVMWSHYVHLIVLSLSILFTPLHYRKKRQTSFDIPFKEYTSDERIKLVNPLAPTGFNFLKANPDEKLVPEFNVCVHSKSNSLTQLNSIIINASPLSYLHSLFIPSPSCLLPQKLNFNAILSFLMFLHLSHVESFIDPLSPVLRGIFNSAGAFASVNHLHFHTLNLDGLFKTSSFPIEELYKNVILGKAPLFEKKFHSNGTTFYSSISTSSTLEGTELKNSFPLDVIFLTSPSADSFSETASLFISTPLTEDEKLHFPFTLSFEQHDSHQVQSLSLLAEALSGTLTTFQEKGIPHNIIFFPHPNFDEQTGPFVAAIFPRMPQKSSLIHQHHTSCGEDDQSFGFCMASVELGGLIMLRSEFDLNNINGLVVERALQEDVQTKGEIRKEIEVWWSGLLFEFHSKINEENHNIN